LEKAEAVWKAYKQCKYLTKTSVHHVKLQYISSLCTKAFVSCLENVIILNITFDLTNDNHHVIYIATGFKQHTTLVFLKLQPIFYFVMSAALTG